MSKIHDAMRQLEHKTAPEASNAGLGNLVGALIEELAHEVPEDAGLEAVKADLLAASRSYEASKKKDLALRFYLATRSLLREHALLQDRLKKAESVKKNQGIELGPVENAPLTAQDRQAWRSEVRSLGPMLDPHSDKTTGPPHS
jgi:hypothetical protein